MTVATNTEHDGYVQFLSSIERHRLQLQVKLTQLGCVCDMTQYFTSNLSMLLIVIDI